MPPAVCAARGRSVHRLSLRRCAAGIKQSFGIRASARFTRPGGVARGVNFLIPPPSEHGVAQRVAGENRFPRLTATTRSRATRAVRRSSRHSFRSGYGRAHRGVAPILRAARFSHQGADPTQQTPWSLSGDTRHLMTHLRAPGPAAGSRVAAFPATTSTSGFAVLIPDFAGSDECPFGPAHLVRRLLLRRRYFPALTMPRFAGLQQRGFGCAHCCLINRPAAAAVFARSHPFPPSEHPLDWGVGDADAHAVSGR